MRTDKDGAALLGAMEYAYLQHQQGVDEVMTEVPGPVVVTVETVDQVFTEIGRVTVTSDADNTVTLDWDWKVDNPSLYVSESQRDAFTGTEIWSAWWESITWTPPEAIDNQTLQFYMGSPDYVVNFDEQTPAQVNAIHPGGVTSVRIRRVGYIGGAQVILDANGTVIPGAGSYDLISPQALDTRLGLITAMSHIGVDVIPWFVVESTANVNDAVDEAIASFVSLWNQYWLF